jgi:uncharacterized protein YjgD (DUF1641 family)
MARPIPFEAPKRDEKVELIHRLQQAPTEHAAALLDAYELLQTLHENKVLDSLRGLIGSGEEVLDIAVKGALQPTSIKAMRNLLVLFNLMGSIDPDTLKKFAGPLPQAVQVATMSNETPGIWGLLKRSLFDRDFRRGLAAMIGVVRGVGIGLGGKQSS